MCSHSLSPLQAHFCPISTSYFQTAGASRKTCRILWYCPKPVTLICLLLLVIPLWDILTMARRTSSTKEAGNPRTSLHSWPTPKKDQRLLLLNLSGVMNPVLCIISPRPHLTCLWSPKSQFWLCFMLHVSNTLFCSTCNEITAHWMFYKPHYVLENLIPEERYFDVPNQFISLSWSSHNGVILKGPEAKYYKS